MSQAPDPESERARYLAGVHGRMPASVFAYWEWQCGRPHCDGQGANFERLVRSILSDEKRALQAVAAVLMHARVREAIQFLEACIYFAANHNQEKDRANRGEGVRLRRLAALKAEELSATLRQLIELEKTSGEEQSPSEACSAVDLLKAAGSRLPLFNDRRSFMSCPLTGIEALQSRFFGSKYWPTVPEALVTLAGSLASQRVVEDGGGAAGLAPLIRRVKRYCRPSPLSWPEIKLSNSEIANLVSVLAPESEGVSAAYVGTVLRRAAAARQPTDKHKLP